MIKSVPGLKTYYFEMPQVIRSYFEHIPRLLDDFPMDICLGYVFSRTETAQNNALYCGLIKLHRANGEVAWNVLIKEHIKRAELRQFFKTVFDHEIPDATVSIIKKAENVRDRVMHGKSPSDPEVRNAIAHVLDYTRDFNAFVYSLANFEPCGGLRGVKGATTPLDKATTKWVLKGMGFPVA